MELVTRTQWGAKPPKNRLTMPVAAKEGIFIHYTSSDSDEQSDHAKCAGRVKGIQDFHMGPSRGWSDIAYSFVVCKHGTIFEGRGWGVVGATLSGTIAWRMLCASWAMILPIVMMSRMRAGRPSPPSSMRASGVEVPRS